MAMPVSRDGCLRTTTARRHKAEAMFVVFAGGVRLSGKKVPARKNYY